MAVTGIDSHLGLGERGWGRERKKEKERENRSCTPGLKFHNLYFTNVTYFMVKQFIDMTGLHKNSCFLETKLR